METFYLPKVTKFIDSLNNDLKDKTISLVDVLKENNGLLGVLDSKGLGKGLFELKITGTTSVRIFYCFHKNTAYLLHGIIKKSQKTPKKDLDYARKMQKLIESL